jgi:outer membrane lipoprotein-sorting protein
MPMKKTWLALMLLWPALLAGPAAAQDSEPWALLQKVRQSLVDAGPTGAVFTQTYVPAGFTSGEQESGRLALSLPDCLRWDYQDPYPKSFLLCGGLAHSWNAQDKTGRRYRIDRRNEPGLDLLMLGVDDLKKRYNATARTVDGKVEVSLDPKTKMTELADAVLVVDPASLRLVRVAYHDQEKNLTRFEIREYRDLSSEGQFSPPRTIRWEDS